jgi:signal transduction histidine kinase
VQVHAVPLRDESGAVAGALVALLDITELRELAVAKDRFLAVASHELRSPLASLNACVELLELDPSAVADPARRKQLLERVRTQVDRLVRLVDGLIETARMRADALPIEREAMDLSAVAREAADLAELGRATRRVRVDAPDPVDGKWDRHRISQVVTNLISNALRYSPNGGEVLVKVRRDGAEAVLAVADQGMGIPLAEQRRLFEPFVRGPEAAAHAPRGLGLGLFISREIARRHGGRITVESTPGQGSLFALRLPI